MSREGNVDNLCDAWDRSTRQIVERAEAFAAAHTHYQDEYVSWSRGLTVRKRRIFETLIAQVPEVFRVGPGHRFPDDLAPFVPSRPQKGMLSRPLQDMLMVAKAIWDQEA